MRDRQRKKDKTETKQPLSVRETVQVISKAFRIGLQMKDAFSIIVSVIGLAMAFSATLESLVLQRFTDEIQQMTQHTGGSLKEAYLLFGILIMIFAAQEIFSFLGGWTKSNDSLRTNRYIRETIIRNSCQVEYKYIDNYDGYKEKIAFAAEYAGEKVAESIQSVFDWITLSITFVSIVLLLGEVSFWIVLMLLLACIPATVLSYLQKDENYMHNTKRMTDGELVIHYFFVCAEELAMAEVRHLGLMDYMKARWRMYANRYLKIKNNLTRKHVIYNSIADFLRNIVYIGVLLICAYRIYQRPELGLGTFMLVFTLSGKFQKTASKLLISIADFFGSIHYMKDFIDVAEMETEDFDSEAGICADTEISFQNVSFTYPGAPAPVLTDLNLTIRPGEKIAVVGENGSGKTTFVNLLCGMYHPDQGEIKIGGKSIFDQLTSVRRSISAVFQNFGRYEGTIRQNIAVSDRKVPADDEKILAIARDVGLDEYLQTQKDGLDEELGTFSKHGNNLSGGQWQKLAICRAMYRDRAPIMVLDEPTAALDPVAETTLYKNFAKVTGDKTTILISHRLGITQLVDRVLVFHRGRIVEDGSHSELLKKNGYYTRMYEAQAKWYQ